MSRLSLTALMVGAALMSLAAAAQADPAERKKGGGETFLQLPTLTTTLTHRDHSRGVLTVEVGLDIQNGALRQRAAASIPLLRAAYVAELQAYAPSIPLGGPPNPDLIVSLLQRATTRVLGQDGAVLLIGTVLEN